MGWLGIDLGTTNTAMVYFDEEEEKIIPIEPIGVLDKDAQGKTFPSLIAFDRDGKFLQGGVGYLAISYSRAFPELVVDKIKRIIGRNTSELQGDALLKSVNYQIVDKDNKALIKIKSELYSPEEITAEILKEAKKQAELYLREIGYDVVIDKATITVPAAFHSNQQQSTREAAEIAGFKEIKTVPEPLAAVFDAMKLGKLDQHDDNVLIVDLGAGTLDIVVVNLRKIPSNIKDAGHEDIVNSLSIGGETKLGGTDIDIQIAEWVLDRLKTDETVNPERVDEFKNNPHKMASLRWEAEDAKISLSTNTTIAEISVPGFSKIVKISRDNLEEIASEFIQQCMDVINLNLEEQNIQIGRNKNDSASAITIDKVILVGGPMSMPAIRKAMNNRFGGFLVEGIDPMLCVARGAAVSNTVKYTNVVNRTFSLLINGINLTNIAIKNSPLPIDAEITYSAEPVEAKISIETLQEYNADENMYLKMGEYECAITPTIQGKKDYWIMCHVGSEQDISVTVIDSEEDREKYFQDVENFNGLFKLKFKTVFGTKIVSEPSKSMDPDIIPQETRDFMAAFAMNNPLIDEILFKSTKAIDLYDKARKSNFKIKKLEDIVPDIMDLASFITARIMTKLFSTVPVESEEGIVETKFSELDEKELTRQMRKIGKDIRELEEFNELKIKIDEFKSIENNISENAVYDRFTINTWIKKIGNIKDGGIKLLNRNGDNQIKNLLNELDKIQRFLEEHDEIMVWSEGGETFRKGQRKSNELKSIIEQEGMKIAK